MRFQGLELSGIIKPTTNWALTASMMKLDTDYERTNSSKDGSRVPGLPISSPL